MRKINGVANDGISRPKPSIAPKVMFLLLVMIITPFAYEGGSIVLAQWQSMYGTYREPKTPVIDAIRRYSGDLGNEIHRRSNRTLLAGKWNPSLAVPLAISWAALGAFFLRRGR